ncbi:hypothetical protein LLG95_11040 [bacterium]|nr:hypothetical protein [bacterium]
MSPDTPSFDFRSPLQRDFEMESTQLGPTTRVFQVEVDPLGGVYYQFGKRVQCIQLPREYAHRQLGIIDMIRVAAVVEVQSRRMIALAVFVGAGTRLFLLGRDNWGRGFDERNVEQSFTDIPSLLRRWKIPVLVHDTRNQLTLDIGVNIHNREVFSQETRACFRDERMAHFLQMGYLYPSGQYFGCRLELREPRSGRPEYFYELEDFPFVWPVMNAAPGAPPEPETPPPIDQAEINAMATERREAIRGSQVIVPDTTSLSLPELMEVLALEQDQDRLWQMIEPNLKMLRPERTYQLILHYGEIIAHRTREWPPARIKSHLGFLPGSILVNIMHTWRVNQILAIAEGNSENQQIMQWLREHEVERLLALNLTADVLSPEQARAILRVDHHADQAAVRRTWRTLVAFLNADYGRSEERPIHRHKDEVVKHLQLARDILLRGMK